jgi:hypothetical protein
MTGRRKEKAPEELELHRRNDLNTHQKEERIMSKATAIISEITDIRTSPLTITLDRAALGLDVRRTAGVYVTMENDEVSFAAEPVSQYFWAAEAGSVFEAKDGRLMTFIGKYLVCNDDGPTVDLKLWSGRMVPCTVAECQESEHLVDGSNDGLAEHFAWRWTDDTTGHIDVERFDDDVTWRVDTVVFEHPNGAYEAAAMRLLAAKIDEAEGVARALNDKAAR